MTLLKVLRKEVLVQFKGVSFLVRPKVEYLGGQAREMPVLARQDGFEQLYTDDLIPIYKQLKVGEKDGYSSLSENQPLVKAGKLSKEDMIDILSRFGYEVLDENAIWAELLDWQPEKRSKGYKLPRGKNAVLYRNWSFWSFENEIDVSDAETIPVKWMEECGYVSKEIVEQLGLLVDTPVDANREYAINNYNGLNALLWDFRLGVSLSSLWEPWGSEESHGALVGRRLSGSEIVKDFRPKISQYLLEYQLELRELKKDLDSFKKLYTELGTRITSVEERIAKLKKMKPG